MIYAKNRETPLEPNHTQFIFIDDEQPGSEFTFRSKFEKAIAGESFTSHEDSNTSYLQTGIPPHPHLQLENVPVVLLVIDGGRETIRKGIEFIGIFPEMKFDDCSS